MGLKKRVERRQGKVDAARASFGTDNVDGGFDRKLNRLKRSVAKAEKKGINVDYDTTDASGVGRSRTTTSSAPTKMAYAETPSPAANLNKGYGMESNSTEKKDLMKDNPIARDASGSRSVGGSWMSKHSKSMGSPMRMMKDSPMEKELVGKQANLPDALKSKIEAAPESPNKMYGGKKGDDSKSKKDYM